VSGNRDESGRQQAAEEAGGVDLATVRAFDRAMLAAFGPLRPLAACPIGWQPSPLAPVFYGARDLTGDDGAPVALRVFFPSLDGAVFSAPPLLGCGRYPLLVFAHGHCPGDATNEKKWFLLPAQLARAGYVVVVPHLAATAGGAHPSADDHPDLTTLRQVIDWARTGWEFREMLLPSPATGVMGHSYGAMVGARFVAERAGEVGGVSAFAGFSGVWQDWPQGPSPIFGIATPTLLTWGGPDDLFTQLSDQGWDSLPKPRHRAIFSEGRHWDYLPAGAVPCDREHGPCTLQGAATADLATMFFGKYAPPELATNLPAQIPDTLLPPDLVLTPDQEFYAGSYLYGLRAMSEVAGCGYQLDHATPNERTVPYVLASPRLVAAADVTEAGLVAHFTGSGSPQAWVSHQSPLPGKIVTAGSTVNMTLHAGPIP